MSKYIKETASTFYFEHISKREALYNEYMEKLPITLKEGYNNNAAVRVSVSVSIERQESYDEMVSRLLETLMERTIMLEEKYMEQARRIVNPIIILPKKP